MLRLFIAIDLPDEILKIICDIQNELKNKNLFRGTFTKCEQSHITLKFLGNTDESLISKIDDSLSKIKFSPFNLVLDCVNFVSDDFIKIIWLQISCDELKSFQQEINQKLFWIGKNEKEFVPHITLARVKSVKDIEELKKAILDFKVPKNIFTINSFSLIKSELTDSGPKYCDIKKYYL